MKAISWLKYFVFLLLIVLVLWVQGKAQSAFSTEYSTTGNINYLLYSIGMLLPILVGVVIGLESFLKERLKEGRWKLNLPKLILFLIPSLYATSLYYVTLIKNETVYNIMIKPFTTFFSGGAFVTMFEILLGYSIITLLYKAEVNKEVFEDGTDINHGEYETVNDNNEFSEGNNQIFAENNVSVTDSKVENEAQSNFDDGAPSIENKDDAVSEETNQ